MSRSGEVDIQNVWKGFRPDAGRRLLRDKLSLRRGKVADKDRLRWVLRDINVNIEPGEAVGLIGSNGSGKSTLLKMCAGVMQPHSGNVDVRGRIGALIEVTSGIHPDLTGHENILMYGALLGWRRKDVLSRLDDIIAFADLQDSVDRKVKYYSSGMKTRLGFATAALLEPDVLLVDEVLAVGDANFQAKCMRRMTEVLGGGTTVVLVSHDLGNVESLCRRVVWLRDGSVHMDGPVAEVLSAYRGQIERDVNGFGEATGLVRCRVDKMSSPARTGMPVEMALTVTSDRATVVTLVFGLSEGGPNPVALLRHRVELRQGVNQLQLSVSALPVGLGEYAFWYAAHEEDDELAPWQHLIHLSVEGLVAEGPPTGVIRLAPIVIPSELRPTDAKFRSSQAATAAARQM